MRMYPCSQCKYQATTQKSLKTHVPTFHNHPPWLTDIVIVIVRADWPLQPVYTEYASEVDSDMKLDNHNHCKDKYLIPSCLDWICFWSWLWYEAW